MFSQHHYQAIAETLDKLGNQPTHRDIVDMFAAMLATDNRKFKPHLFYFAAGEPEQALLLKPKKTKKAR